MILYQVLWAIWGYTFLERTLDKGGTVTIPSLGIVIMTERLVCDTQTNGEDIPNVSFDVNPRV